MKTMKRALAALLAALMLGLSGCGPAKDDAALETTRIMTSFYPIYALAVNIFKDVPATELSCLVQPQTGCLRSYSLSDWDAAILASQDAVILGGCGLESFEAALNSLTDGPALLTLLNGLTLRDNGKSAGSDESSHLDGPNPWLFLSVSGAIEMCISLGYGMAQLDELFAARYTANADAYIKRLETLAQDMRALVAAAPKKPVACLHEGLGYFAEELGLPVAAELNREPGTEPLDNDLDAMLTDLKESGAELVLLEREAPLNFVNALESAGYATVRLDTLTAHTADGDLEAYERIMLENARLTAQALRAAGQS